MLAGQSSSVRNGRATYAWLGVEIAVGVSESLVAEVDVDTVEVDPLF